MEQQTSSELADGPFAPVIDLVVKERRLYVLCNIFETPRRQGSLEGLEMCRTMRNGEVLDFDLALVALKEENLIRHIAKEAGELTMAELNRYTHRVYQVQSCYELLRVAHYAEYGEPYQGLSHQVYADTIGTYNALAPQVGMPQTPPVATC